MHAAARNRSLASELRALHEEVLFGQYGIQHGRYIDPTASSPSSRSRRETTSWSLPPFAFPIVLCTYTSVHSKTHTFESNTGRLPFLLPPVLRWLSHIRVPVVSLPLPLLHLLSPEFRVGWQYLLRRWICSPTRIADARDDLQALLRRGKWVRHKHEASSLFPFEKECYLQLHFAIQCGDEDRLLSELGFHALHCIRKTLLFQ